MVHGVLAFSRRNFQDFHVDSLRHGHRVSVAQQVPGDAELAGREHFLAIPVIGKGTRFSHQRIDQMTIVDIRSPLADQPLHRLHQVALIHQNDLLGADSNIDLFADQSAGNRVDVGANPDRAAATDAETADDLFARQTLVRQPRQVRLFFRKFPPSIGVAASHDLFDQLHVLVATGEVPTSPQQQRLFDAVLDVAVGRFDVAVFVGTAGIGSLGLTTVILHQGGVTIGQRPAAGVIFDRGTERVRAMPVRHAAELPKRFLDPLAEGFKRFGKTEAHRFGVAVSQHAVKQRVVKSLAGDFHAVAVHDGEVAGGQPRGVMVLAEKHRLAGAAQRPPSRDPPLERSPRRIGELAGIFILQPLEKRLRPEQRFFLQPPLDRVPDGPKRIASRPVLAGPFPLGGEPAIIPVFPRGFVTHFCPPCRVAQRFALTEHASQFLDLSVRDHRKLL